MQVPPPQAYFEPIIWHRLLAISRPSDSEYRELWEISFVTAATVPLPYFARASRSNAIISLNASR
jgi:hypothetical protein